MGLSHTCIDFTWNLRDFEADQGKRYVHKVAVVHSGLTWVFLEGLHVGKVPSSMNCPEAMSLLRQGGELLGRGILGEDDGLHAAAQQPSLGQRAPKGSSSWGSV